MGGINNSNINLTVRKRLVLLFIIIFFIMFALIVRLGWIQLVRGRELYNLANEQWTNDVKIDAKRGKILDRNGAELAVSASCERVDVFMKDVLNAEKENKDIKQQIASKLSEILGDKEEDLLKLLNKKLSNGNPINSVTIKRRIDDSQAKKIRELDLPGIVISDDSKRYYPNGNLLSQVLGFTNIDGDGQEGVELKYDKELKGTPGRIIMEADLYRRQLPYNISKYIDPIDGKDIQLTIDESVQLYVEKAIEDALVVNKAKAVTAIVMDPSTGDILAMASKPDFNPNDPRNMGNLTDFKEVQKLWNNRAVTFTYEPGSIFKVVTATAALSEGKVSDNDRFVCNGSKTVAGTTMHCWKYGGHGVQTFAQIIQNSCNVGFMILGERLGKDLLYKYIDAYGFGAKTGIDVNFEETGIKMPIKKVGPVELANIAFGQGIVVTPIQMVSTYAAIANNGKMVKPRLVKSIVTTDKDGNITDKKDVKQVVEKQVISEDVAKKMRGYLESVISIGGGHKAYVEGYRIGGKTGTAQKAMNGSYVHGKYVASFVGIAPIDNPKFVVYVSIDEPDPSKYYAGQIVAPVAGQIFKDLFISLNIPPDNSAKSSIDVIVPNVSGLSKSQAINKLKSDGFTVEAKGEGNVVSDMLPRPGMSVKAGSKIILYMGSSGNYNDKVVVPDLTGKDDKEASDILKSVGLKIKPNGEGMVTDQKPEPGQEVKKGTTIDVDFEMYLD